MSKTAAAVAFTPAANAPPDILMMAIAHLYLASEAPKGLELQVRDSSRGSPLTDAELKASIYAKGIIQPLIWKEHGDKHYVIAGNRRLRFLREIFADALTSTVQTQNVDDFGGDWREVAIDTNLSLPPHLVERYELIVKLAADLKLSPDDTKARFGMSTRQYNQVMALGKMSPIVRQAWKDAAIDAKTAQAFTLEPDPKEQEKIFNALSKNGRFSDWEVRRKTVPASQQEIGKLIAFVGLDGLKSANLLKQENWFNDDHVVTDPKALQKLVADRLDTKCKGLVEAGWAWALPESNLDGSKFHYGSFDPAKKSKPTSEEKLRLEQLQALIDAPAPDDDEDFDDEPYFDEKHRILEEIKERGYTPEQRKKGGCILEITRDGKLNIEYGRIKPSQVRSVQASERSATKKKAKASKPGVVTLTNALAERLSAQLEKAVAASLHATPHVAVAGMIAAFASDGHVIDVEVGGTGRNSYGKTSSDKNFAQVFEGALKATPESRVVMLCKVAVEAVRIQIHSATAKAPIDDVGLQAMVAAMDGKFLNNAIADEFDAKDYFAGVALQACVDAVRCSMGEEHAAKVAKMKKGEAAKFAGANVPAKGWLPRELRTVHYKGPTESTPQPKPVASKAKKPPSMLSKAQQKAVKAGGARAGKAALAKK